MTNAEKEHDSMVQNNNSAPDPDSGNPFDLIAYLIFTLRQSLEAQEGNRPPRWVRIAGANTTQGETDVIGKGVKAAVIGVLDAVTWMTELILDIKELLIQTDAAKALVQTTTEFFVEATSDRFVNSVQALLGQSPGDNPLSGVGGVMEDVEAIVDYVPEPEDLIGIEQELFRLLCIVQRPLPPRDPDIPYTGEAVDQSTEDHLIWGVNVGTGKLRLLQWAFQSDYTIYGLGPREDPESREQVVTLLGTRRLISDAVRPARSKLVWHGANRDVEIFNFPFVDSQNNPISTDVTEFHAVLTALGYRHYNDGGGVFNPPGGDAQGIDALVPRLERFQQVNDLPMTGQLDNQTINRLLNLDFEHRRLVRAKPYDPNAVGPFEQPVIQRAGYFALHNGDADTPGTIDAQRGRYAYYLVGTPVPIEGDDSEPAVPGWMSEARPQVRVPAKDRFTTGWSLADIRSGFVGAESRKLRPAPAGAPQAVQGQLIYDFDDGAPLQSWPFSEGEAADGRFFFYALATQPWIPGRWRDLTDDTSDSLLGPGAGRPANGVISQIYQWIDLQPILTLRSDAGLDAATDLYVTASTLQRVLFRETYVDCCRVRVELYPGQTNTAADSVRPSPADINEDLPPYEQSEWFPSGEFIDASVHLSNKAVKRNWIYRATQALLVPPGITRALVILEGLHLGGWDIDAYFDQVRLAWEIRER